MWEERCLTAITHATRADMKDARYSEMLDDRYSYTFGTFHALLLDTDEILKHGRFFSWS